MFQWLRNAASSFGRKVESMTLRRWEAAETNRLNKAHWEKAQGNSVNQDLLTDRDTLVARSLHEIENGFIAGIVETHIASVVGPEGPQLAVESDSEEYNEALEWLVYDWWQQPELTGTLHGIDLLKMCVRLLWACGEFLFDEADDPDVEDGVSFRLNMIHPRRLVDPMLAANSRIVLGVERNQIGKPIAYFIRDYDSDEFGMLGSGISLHPRKYDAKRIIHGFHQIEPGQVRGIPLAAPCLQTAADLRDLDKQVLDACRLQADHCVVLYTEHPDAPFTLVNESTPVKRRQIVTAPPLYKPVSVQPTQPSVNHVQYRQERLRELGRPINMPLMMVLLHSGDHTYSSARFDGQLYNRGIQGTQKWLDRTLLNRCVSRVEREGMLRRKLPKRPKRVTYNWTWPVAPHVDPQKEAEAWALLVSINAASEYDVAAALGTNLETVAAMKAKAKKLFEEHGIEPAKATEIATAAASRPRESSKEGKKDKQVA